ncbi:MAG: aldo/keto reductase [Candidatus Bathyarchaeia archaeon]
MNYRKFGRINWQVSVLGFGAMRLPILNGDPTKINEPEAVKMIRYAVDHGVNYVDTAYVYHGGNSEVVVGKALKGEYRNKAKVATKMPIRQINSKDDFDKVFNEQLRRLQRNYIDFYLFHGLNRDTWKKALELNALKWVERQVVDGKIKYFGFSFHDEFKVFKEVIDSYDWDFCQIQYNYVDFESSRQTPGREGLEYAASKGLAVVIMEPIKGGLLAVTPPKEIKALWDDAGIKRTPAELALLWVFSHPEVAVVLSGMTTMKQVIENVNTACRLSQDTLSSEELKAIERIREKHREYGFVGCTGCRYCTPCPQGVSIPEILAFYNENLRSFDEKEKREAIEKYYANIPKENRIDVCIKCGECEEKCPQNLPIRNLISHFQIILNFAKISG